MFTSGCQNAQVRRPGAKKYGHLPNPITQIFPKRPLLGDFKKLNIPPPVQNDIFDKLGLCVRTPPPPGQTPIYGAVPSWDRSGLGSSPVPPAVRGRCLLPGHGGEHCTVAPGALHVLVENRG